MTATRRFTSPFFAFHQTSMHFPRSFFQTGPLFSDEYDLNGNENFDDEQQQLLFDDPNAFTPEKSHREAVSLSVANVSAIFLVRAIRVNRVRRAVWRKKRRCGWFFEEGTLDGDDDTDGRPRRFSKTRATTTTTTTTGGKLVLLVPTRWWRRRTRENSETERRTRRRRKRGSEVLSALFSVVVVPRRRYSRPRRGRRRCWVSTPPG